MLKPVRDIVLVKTDPVIDKKGSIFIAEEWKSLPEIGTVLAIGPEVKSVSIGDRIRFERYASIVLEDDERLCKESSIFGIYEKN